MRHTRLRHVLAAILCIGFTLPLFSAEFALMKNGAPACSIVLPTEPGPVITHAAEELALFLGKIAGGAAPKVVTLAEPGLYPVYLALSNDTKLHDDGFRLTASKKELRIEGKDGNGVLYGAYDILNEYGGIRWLFPGDEGEYFTLRPTIAVPEGTTLKNPDFTYRDIVKVCMSSNSAIWKTWDWAVRNKMRFTTSSTSQHFKNGLDKYGPIAEIGGHCFSPLLCSSGLTGADGKRLVGKVFEEHAEKLFEEHPDYFPLINGERVKTFHGGAVPQPCTTNPDVIHIVAQNVLKFYAKSPHPVMVIFGNNDCTQWCQCDRCKALDPKEEAVAGIISTRYWTFANALAEEVYQAKPDMKFNGWTYQNYSEPPKGVKPNKHIGLVMISNHRRCWKHALDDKKCPTNCWYYEYQKNWNDYGVPLYTYEMLSDAGHKFIPVENDWVDTLRLYREKLPNYTGMKTEMSCPDGIFNPPYNSYFVLNNWRMMWQAMYLGVTFQWDVNGDYDKVYEEINSLYYGEGWAAGIRDFRALLTKLYMDAPGCWGYGHSTSIGKFLDAPGAKEKLYEYLDAAEKVAATDADPRALAHVRLEREYFEKTWVAAYRDYITNYREPTIYPLMGKITMDGKLDELDWRNAETITRFRPAFGRNLIQHQTGIKLAYDAENLYVGFECLESKPKELKTTVTQHDGPIWEDNDVELFINDPMMGGNYIQLLVNAAGVVCDGTVAAGQAGRGMTRDFESNVEVKTSFAKDRYFVEMRIPSDSITGGRFTAGTVLKINSLRCRRIESSEKETEMSIISGGTLHGADSFMPVTFATPRSVTSGNRSEVDTRILGSGSFNEVATEAKRIPKHWTIKDGKYPGKWGLSDAVQYGGDLEMLLHPDSTDNYFVRLRKGFIFQEHKARDDNLRMSLQVRGRGTLRIGVLRYAAGWKKGLGTVTIKVLNVDSADWKHEVFDFKRPEGEKTDVHCIMFWPQGKDAEIDLDDVILVGLDAQH